MPVIQIQSLPQRSGIDVTATIKIIAQCAASAFDVPANQVWVTWQTIDPAHYTEGANHANEQPRDTHPPIVNVMAYEGRSPQMIKQVLEVIAQALCERLGMAAGNAFITYTELQAGRVYTGGAVR